MGDRADSDLIMEPADNMKAAGPSDPKTNSTPEISGPMLDVHAPQESIYTWKSFLIHIATICAESARNLQVLADDVQSASGFLIWVRSAIDQIQQATPHDGIIMLTLPSMSMNADGREPSRAVWAVAKAKGTVALLPENLAEVYDRLDYDANNCDEAQKHDSTAQQEMIAAEARLHLALQPGAQLRLSPGDRDEVLRILAARYAAIRALREASAKWAGSSEAILHNVRSRSDMNSYLARHLRDLP